ncbi:hypothetical protein [Nannocystis punicea]|uniref:Secreted protein n=1 Tax=Nannocystis punicea TaxID=2995304 RepID=A0ABY7GUC9_9BACT|nr:hypothetical protein [Nannocystis poenicansa]WAS90553.1 hypothetical protein O0S08_30570 [Nannocystis poenicansa]
MALLIAVSTALLFAAGARMRILEGASEEVCSVGEHDVPVVSRQQESLDRSARRNETDPVLPPRSADYAIDMSGAFSAWPLPPPSPQPRMWGRATHQARGPPAGRC